MSLFAGVPHMQYCPKCGWKIVVKSDALVFSHCPKCETKLEIRKLSTFEKLKNIICSHFSFVTITSLFCIPNIKVRLKN